MLKFGNKEFRNLQEQVLKNMQNIANLKEGTAVLSEFGIKVVGEVDSLQNLSSVDEYKLTHADWEYGDAFAIGTKPPYKLVILTRANDEITADHWFDIGDFPMPGPKGDTGAQGEIGPQGPQGNQGDPGVDAGFGSILATAQTLSAGSSATATVVASGPDTAKELSFTFGIPRGADGGSASWGNIQGTLSNQTDLKNALDDKQDELVSGTNIKTINNQSVIGSGNIEINSGVWGNITGDISNQSDLQTALNAKADITSLATVATTGSYNDLSNKPTIGTGTITIKKNGETIDSFGLNQTSSQNINISVPTKVSDLTNDSGFISGVAWGDITGTLSSQTDLSSALASKQDTISDLETIRSGAEAGATAVQPLTLTTELATKQDVISDLSDIRSGAAKGASAVQPSSLSTVATSGSYNDLSDKPTIGNATLTIQKNGTNVGTFTANADTSKSINITVPTTTSQLTNDSDYVVSSDLPLVKFSNFELEGANILKSIQINNDKWNFDTSSSIAWGSITGTLSEQTDLQTALNGKQDTISDLDTIRSGAALGATALQSAVQSVTPTSETWTFTLSDGTTITKNIITGITVE